MTKIYMAVKVYVTFHLLYELWVFLFHRKIYGLWDKLYRCARVIRIILRRWDKKLEAVRLERRKRHKMREKRRKKENLRRILLSIVK